MLPEAQNDDVFISHERGLNTDIRVFRLNEKLANDDEHGIKIPSSPTSKRSNFSTLSENYAREVYNREDIYEIPEDKL